MEFALVLPVLMLIVLGLISTGLTLSHQLSVSLAAREAARYGATLPASQCQPTSACGGRTWAQLVQAVAVQRAGGEVAAPGVCVALVQGPGTAPVAVDASHTTAGGTASCYVDHSADSGSRIQIAITRPDEIQLLVTSIHLDLATRATARPEL